MTDSLLRTLIDAKPPGQMSSSKPRCLWFRGFSNMDVEHCNLQGCRQPSSTMHHSCITTLMINLDRKPVSHLPMDAERWTHTQ